MMKKTGILVGLLMLTLPVRAEIPETGTAQHVKLDGGTSLDWLLKHSDHMDWNLTVSGNAQVLIDANLGNCHFCEGEEDNCSADGIFIRQINGIDTPITLAVCHTGAHGQQLQLFDPAVSASIPAMLISGSYFVDWRLNDNGTLTIEWDGDGNRISGCSVDTDSSLELAPPQNRLVIDSPCYRISDRRD